MTDSSSFDKSRLQKTFDIYNRKKLSCLILLLKPTYDLTSDQGRNNPIETQVLETNLLYYNRTLGHNNRQRRAAIRSLKSTRNSETVDIRNIRSILVITNIDKLQFDRYRFCLAGVGTVGRFFSFSSGAKEGSVQSSISNLILELVKIYKNVRKIVFTPRHW